MAFHQSTITFSQAQTRIADAAGASGSSAELTRASYAIQNAFQYLDNKYAWNWLQVTATSAVTGGTADYALPADFKFMYDIRLSGNPRTLGYIDKRTYDRMVWNQTAQGTPTHYTLYQGMDQGKFTLIPTPGGADTATISYHRRMTIPSVGASALDCPDDFDFIVMALGKWFYLLDKGGDTERTQGWKEIGVSSLNEYFARDNRIPDQDKAMIPVAAVDQPFSVVNPNTTIPFLYEP